MDVSQENPSGDSLIVRYNFVKFNKNSVYDFSVTKYTKYFAECAIVSQELVDSQKTTVKLAMQEWEKITNVKFLYDPYNPNLFISASQLNYFSQDNNREVLGAGWEFNYKKQQVLFIDYTAGHVDQERALWLVIHELGHVPFRLEHLNKHPVHIRENFDNSLASVMSYNHISNNYNNKIYPVTPSHFDISLTQQKFGINNIATKGNNIYKYSYKNIGHYTIFDCSGEDLIDLSEFKENVNVNLTAGTHINNIAAKFSFSIYQSTIIENIATGSGNDVIYGNDADNKIKAGAGRNEIYGGAGNDYFIFNKHYHSKNVIKDFQLSMDKIVLENFNFSCNDVSNIVVKNNDKTTISPSPFITIELQGDYHALACADFIFV